MEPEFRLATTADIDLLIEFMRQFYAVDQYSFSRGHIFDLDNGCHRNCDMLSYR